MGKQDGRCVRLDMGAVEVLVQLSAHWLPCALIMLAACLMTAYNRPARTQQPQDAPAILSLISGLVPPRRPQDAPPPDQQPLAVRRPRKSRFHKTARGPKPKKHPQHPARPATTQPFDAFLVLDLEGTCELGTDFDYPNEIIEFPVRLLQWKDRAADATATVLEPVDEFRTFVRPTWRPTLSAFCTQLTGITQDQVDAAPRFSEALSQLEAFLVKNGLVDPATKKRLKRFCWCSDGPWDIRDFFVKQCFISQLTMPEWIRGDVLDVRSTVAQWRIAQTGQVPPHAATKIRTPLNISAQLKLLDLPAFEGRQHSGIDDTRNIARIVTELARRGVRLVPNTTIYPGRRWRWMGKHGQILEDVVPREPMTPACTTTLDT